MHNFATTQLLGTYLTYLGTTFAKNKISRYTFGNEQIARYLFHLYFNGAKVRHFDFPLSFPSPTYMDSV